MRWREARSRDAFLFCDSEARAVLLAVGSPELLRLSDYARVPKLRFYANLLRPMEVGLPG